VAAPSLRPPRSVRSTGQEPEVVTSPPGAFVSTVAARAAAELEKVGEGTVAVITPVSLLEATGHALTAAGLAMLFAIAVTDPQKAGKTVATLRAELEKLQMGPIHEDELVRAKVKLLTSTVIEGESTRARMMGLVDSWLSRGRLETLEEVQAAIEAVTVGEVNYLAGAFAWGSLALESDVDQLKVHVRHLREKLERNPSAPEYLTTVRGVGYRLRAVSREQ